MARIRPPLAAALVAGLGLLLSAAPAGADVVHLKTGETIKGRLLQERITDDTLVIVDVLTGGLRQIRWEVVTPEDRDRIRELLGLQIGDPTLAKGHRIVYRLEGGATAELFGVIERKTDAEVAVRSDGQVHRIARTQVVGEPDPVDLDPRTVWTGPELWDVFLAELRKKGMNPDEPDAQLSWLMAQKAEWLDLLEESKKHYERVAGDPSHPKSEVAKQRLARVEALLRDKAARETLREVKRMLSNNLFRRARTLLDGFLEANPEAGDEVKKEHEKLKGKATEQRTKYFQQMAGREFPEIVEDLLRPKVKEKNEKGEEITLSEVTSWTRRELPDKAFEALAEKMKSRDDVTPDEARTFWDGRPKRGWIRKSYGDGSFIVNPPKIKPPKPRKSSNAPKNPPKGPQVKLEMPKPPTRDQWWEKADNNKRVNWAFAFFGENSELFEVGAREFRQCAICQGTGLESSTSQSGDVISWLCRRCAGSQQDITAKFR